MLRRTLDLTGDRPLPLREARKLARFWTRFGSVTLSRAGTRRKRLYNVKVS